MTTLLDLEKKQIDHDQKCHRDIFFLNFQDRFKHMVMHYGKYSGRLADILREKTESEKINFEVRRTLIDCFIIVLSSAEMLQMDLDVLLRKKIELDKPVSIHELSEAVKESSPDIFSLLNVNDEKSRILNLMLEMTSIGGFMQKVGEDLDHLVGIPRDAIKQQTLNMLSLLLLAGLVWNVDYECDTQKRWDVLSEKTVIQGPQ